MATTASTPISAPHVLELPNDGLVEKLQKMAAAAPALGGGAALTPGDFPNAIYRGSTTHFKVYYDPSTGANGPALADGVLATCESEYTYLHNAFSGLNTGPYIIVIASTFGGAYHANCAATELYCSGNATGTPDLNHVRMMVVAEEVEVFEAGQNRGWNCGYSNGEGLSRILATELYPNSLNGFNSASTWLNTAGRPDFVNTTDPTDRNYVSIGCSVLFINYLHYQLGYSWSQIIAAGANTLGQTYTNLTGKNVGLNAFKSLLQDHFPAGTSVNIATDNVFPLSYPLFMAWKGSGNDQGIWYSQLNGATWAAQRNVGGVATSHGPSIAWYNGLVYMAWKGMNNDQGIWYSYFDGVNWAPQQQVPGVATSVGPSLAVYNGQLYMAWKGMNADQGIYYSHYNGSTWAAQQQVSGVATSVGPSLAVYNGSLYMAWKGMNTDQGIWYSHFNGSTWAAQQEVPGVATSVGPSLATFNGNLYMAWKGMNTDQRIWFTHFNGSAWAAQQDVPGIATSVGPSLAAYNGNLYMSWKGMNADQGIYYSHTSNGNTWAAQINIPGIGTSVGPQMAA